MKAPEVQAAPRSVRATDGVKPQVVGRALACREERVLP
jgi:hypothetical protein